MATATLPLLVFGNYAVPQEGTVLHELVTGERTSVSFLGKELPVPNPSSLAKTTIKVLGTATQVVILRPPFTFLNKLLIPAPEPIKLQAWEGLTRWVHGSKRKAGAYGQVLEDCCSFRVPCVRAYNICHPAVPEGEVWTSLGDLPKDVHLMRFPTASEAAMERKLCKKVRYHHPIVFTNPKNYKEFHGGDSDGDQSNLCAAPDENGVIDRTKVEVVDMPDMLFRLSVPKVEVTPKQQDTVSIARGYQAKRVVGLITWYAWMMSAAHAQRTGRKDAYNEAWRFFGNLLELAFDGRKDGMVFDSSILQALANEGSLPEGLAEKLGCADIGQTIAWAYSTKQSVGFRIWLRRFRCTLPTVTQSVIKGLLNVWEGNYKHEQQDAIVFAAM